MDKLKIAGNFSRYAHLYDNYASVQNKAASELASSLEGNSFTKILELGCGTGNYTLMLRKKFKDARIRALDISEKMVGLAKDKLKNENVEFIIADAEDIIPDGNFDLVTSNACFQWLNNLEKVLPKYAEFLPKGGTVSFSIFGPQTFCELNSILKSVLKDCADSAYFCGRRRIKEILKANFKSVKIEEVFYEESFSSLKELLEKIKYSGIRGNGLNKKIYFSRSLLKKLEKAYRDRFQEICVTYQVFFCRGEK